MAGQTRRYPARLLATGQTTVYVAGDNGTYKTGREKRYTILTTGQYSNTTNITINSKTDAHSNNCVVDLETGRMWSRTIVASVGPNSDGKLPWTNTGSGVTLEGIFAYCAAANAAALSGYSDWRIPNIFEIISLSDWEAPTGVPDATAFPAFTSAATWFWVSTTLPSGTTNGVLFKFTDLGLSNAAKTTGTSYYCMLVRG